jgi:uncharacterized protein YraI
MQKAFAGVIFGLSVLAGCSAVVGSRAVVQGVGSDDMLKLRAGPGLGYDIIMGLPDGTVLNQHECVTEVGQRWCHVSVASGIGVSGYVSADYLSTK